MPDEPTYTQDDIDQAHAEGYDEGYSEGVRAGYDDGYTIGRDEFRDAVQQVLDA